MAQDRADFQIDIICPKKDQKSSVYDFSSYLGLDELVLLDRSQCLDAKLVVRPYEKIDQFSPYLVRVEEINQESGELEILRAITEAGFINAKARLLKEGARRTKLFELIASKLISAISVSKGELNQHLKMLIAGAYFALNRKQDAKLIFEQIIRDHGDSISVFKAMAYFELAPLIEGAENQERLYKMGEQIGIKLANFRVQAKGANFRSVELINNGNISEALQLIQKAHEIYLSNKSWRDIFDPLHNLSWANLRAGNYELAIEHALKQKLLAESFQSDVNVVWALYNLARSYSKLGEIFVVGQLVDSAVSKIDQIPPERKVLKGYFLSEKVEHLIKFEKSREAEVYAKRLIEVFEDQQWPAKLNEARYKLAEVAFMKGELVRAKQIFSQVLAYNKTNKRVGDEAKVLIKLAEIEIAFGNIVESNIRVRDALYILTELDDKPRLAKSLLQATSVLLESGAVHEAAVISNLSRNKIIAYGSEDDRARFSLINAKIERSQGNNESALLELEKAKIIIEKALPKIFREDLRQVYLALNKTIFEFNIQLLLDDSEKTQRVEEALVIADAFKARTLNERLRYSKEYRSAMSTDSKNRKRILAKITKHAATVQLADEEALEAASLDAYEAATELNKLEARLLSRRKNRFTGENNPAPHLTDANLESLSYREAEITLSYFIGEKKSWLWILTTEGVTVEEIPSRSELEILIDELLLRASIRPNSRADGGHWSQVEAIKKISEAILYPADEYLNASINRINIVPDGVLHRVPFAALQLPEQQSPLIEAFSLVYAPALRNLASSSARTGAYSIGRPQTALAVSNPLIGDRLAIRFPELPFSELEGASLKRYLGKKVTLMNRGEAVKKAVLAEIEKDHSILHFATHGALNDLEPHLSGLILAGDELDQAILVAPEISALDIQAELVVLSGCETAIGKSQEGEGLISLSRAFLQAGAGHVIGAQWRVQDQATSVLFNEFYHNLIEENMSTAQSLRLAQLAVYNNRKFDWLDPFFWAGFQIQTSK